MTSTVMLAAMRTILDESSASFWTDAEAYAALADGQNEVIKEVLAVYKARRRADPNTELVEELRTLLTFESAGIAASFKAIYTGFLYLVNANWDHDASGTEEPCRIVEMDRGQNHRESNTFLAATATDPIAYVAPEPAAGGQSINFRPVYSTTATYSLNYLKSPTDIAAGTNATLPVTTHSAIVNYATARMLEKDQRPEAQMIYGKYLQELKTILGL